MAPPITTMILGDLTSGYFKLFTLGNLPVGSPKRKGWDACHLAQVYISRILVALGIFRTKNHHFWLSKYYSGCA